MTRVGLLLVAALAACSDPTPCVTGGHADGSYTLALDGMCLDGITTNRLVDGAWQTAGAELAWQPAASGGLAVTLLADAPAQALELAIPEPEVDQMFQQGYQSWGFSGTVAIPSVVPPVSICELTPMTSPRALSSGPPELPWLIGASVWMTWSIVKLLGAVIGL